MNDKEKKPLNIPELMISVFVTCVVLAGMYYLCETFNLPTGLTGALILFVLSLYLTLSKYNSLDTPKRVCFIGLTFATLILSSLFAYKHFVTEIRITVLHIGIIILIPFLVWKILEKKSQNK
jgi:hypothetical protein